MALCDTCIHNEVCLEALTPEVFYKTECKYYMSKERKMNTRILELIQVKASIGGPDLPDEVYNLINDESVMFQNLDVTQLDLYVIPRVAGELNSDNVYVLIAGPIDNDKEFIAKQLDKIEDIIKSHYEIIGVSRSLEELKD